MHFEKWACSLLLVVCCFFAADTAADDPSPPLTGDAFVDALAERLELDWNACPAIIDGARERPTDDLRCAVIGDGDPFHEAEQLGLLQALNGGKVLDIESNDGLPDHLYATHRALRPIAAVGGYERLVYLIDGQRVSMWIEQRPTPLVEGGEPERWIAIRVDALEEPFPDFIPAVWRPEAGR